MNKILLIIAILSLSVNAQTVVQGNLIVNENTTLGQNCGNGLETITYTGNLIFNSNKTLVLKGINLIILGNVIGSGTITHSCNNNQSSICINGTNDSNITYNGILLNTCVLSIKSFDINKDFDYNYTVHDLTGRLLHKGKTNTNMLYYLPKNTILIITVEGFKSEKLLIN